MPNLSATEVADTEGPNASLQSGDATRMKDLQRQAGHFALGGQMGAQPGPPGAAPPQAPGGLPQPAQPAPPGQRSLPGQDNTRLDLNSVFSPERDQPMGWRQRLGVWAAHPHAGPALRTLAALAHMDQHSGDRSQSAPQPRA